MNEPTFSHYRVNRKLGAGGMGEVYLADDTRLDRKVAIKLLPPELSDDSEMRGRFTREAKTASALNHPHVCVIYEVGESQEGCPYIAMEYIEGVSLHSRIETGPLELRQLVDITIQVADALDAAHAAGIVHRDIKPANIVLTDRGKIKVLDFGLAKRLPLSDGGGNDAESQLQHTRAGQILGTPNYMSPEQALGKTLDHRTDLFSVGVVIYEMATGRLPFAGTSLGETISKIVSAAPDAMARFNYDVPTELDRITRKCLQKDCASRYQSARDLQIDLEQLHATLVESDSASASAADGSQPPATLNRPSLHEVRKSDIFIGCAEIDDQPLSPGKQGWISQFHRNLKIRLEQLSGEPVSIASYPMPAGSAPLDPTVFESLPDVKTMVSVVSPPFAKSEGCCRGVEEFCQRTQESGQFLVEDRPRLFKVLKAPVDLHDMPPQLREMFQRLMAFEFFERDPETGRFREFDESFGEAAQQRYYEKIYDLAYEIADVLKRSRRLEASSNLSASANGKRVYLAETTSDLQASRDRIRRELTEQGHTVWPDRPLPMVAGQLVETINNLLEECDLAIHMVGERYGMVPEDADQSVVAMQNALAAEHSDRRGLERLIWMPKRVQPRDDRQVAFIQDLVENPESQRGADVIEDTLENLKEILEARWKRCNETQVVPASGSAGTAPRVYLVCDQKDETAVEPLEDYFYGQAVEVSLPEFQGDEATVSEVHWQNLRDCDAVLVYYGAATKSWVDIKLRELIKAVGYRNGNPIAIQSVFIAPPHDRRKERFKSLSAEVIRQPADEFQGEFLEGFVLRLKQLDLAKSKGA